MLKLRDLAADTTDIIQKKCFRKSFTVGDFLFCQQAPIEVDIEKILALEFYFISSSLVWELYTFAQLHTKMAMKCGREPKFRNDWYGLHST